jgi:PAS domain-containing protein
LVFAQSVLSDVEAATVDALPVTDSVLPSLPGVLIAGLALIFAIRERSTTQEFKARLEEAEQLCRKVTKEAVHYRATLDHSNIGLWQVDLNGFTLYANTVMCQLLGISDIEEIKNVPDHQFLAAERPDRAMTPTYPATLIDKKGNKREVLIFERTVAPSADSMSIRVRTVMESNSFLSDSRIGEQNVAQQPRRKELRGISSEKFTAIV